MGLSASAASLAIDAALDDVTHVKLHTGDPGTAGSSNAFADTSRQAVSFGAGASGVAVTAGAATWSSLTAAGTITHVSLWTAASGGTFRGRAPLLVPRDVNIGDSFELTSVTMSVVPGAS